MAGVRRTAPALLSDLATSPGMDDATGPYFFHGKATRSKPITYDPEVAARLWAISEQLSQPGGEINKESLEAMK